MHKLSRFLGVQLDATTHIEKFISMLGGFVSILLILIITQHFLGVARETTTSLLIIASMGASAVLLFAVPHGPLSQPWPVIASHLLSSIIGVSCYLLVPDLFIAAALAVSLSIFLMHYLRCIHPPGGATALAAVVSGSEIHALGYGFVFTPVLLNAVTIVIVAVLFNLPFKWRRYPVALSDMYTADTKKKAHPHSHFIPRKDLEFALKSMRTFADITEAELERIYQTAREHTKSRDLNPSDIKLGHYYLHGKNDGKGVIRRVIDQSEDSDIIIYKTITGPDKGKTAAVKRQNFARWARHEVVYKNNTWEIAAPPTEN